MSIQAPERVTELPGRLSDADKDAPVGSLQPEQHDVVGTHEAPVSVAFTCLVALLSSAAAAYAAASVFDGIAPIPVAIAGALLGSGMVWFSFRTKRPAVVQFLIVPVAAVAGSLLLIPDARGGSANLPSLVVEALRSGGISQPPVPFDPGWRFLLVLTMAVVSGGTAAVATGINRVRLAVFLPVPLLFGGLMAQSGDVSLIPTIVSLVLLVAALAVAFGVELAREGATSGRFELRRLGKGAASLLALIALLAGITQLGFLFPEAAASRVVPPQRPEAPPPEPDRELFTVESTRQVPWRVGVLDVYDGRGWLTPPFDTNRLVEIESNGSVPEVSGVPGAPVGQVRGADPGDDDSAGLSVTFNISDIPGHVVPGVANPTDIDADGFSVQYDPRTQTLRLPTQRASRGMSYTVEAPLPPTGDDLATAGDPPEEMNEFLSAPPVPPQVQNAIAQAPRGIDLFTRLQYVREKLYEKVVAKGAGKATDVPPARVAELMSGEPGTPFEITAAEALLARWVGVPSRVGYGYFGGDDVGDDLLSVRPDDGATWLEVYFQDYGWVPILGTPPRAQSSLGSADKNYDSSVRPAENLTLFSYVPVRQKSIPLLYTIVQYWVARIAPIVALLGLATWLYPGVVKIERRRRRAQWGRDRGEQILVAYAEFRDSAFDLGLGHPTLTPLEFVSTIEDDNEHRELAWLVTRALWGDLARDVRADDAFVADEMGRSLTTRLRTAQSGMNRVFAFASRNSLRDPFTNEIPNLWWPAADPSAPLLSRVRKRVALAAGAFRVFRRAQPVAAAVVLMVLLGGCAQQLDLASQAPAALPERIVPSSLDGITFRREEAMERPYSEPNPDSLVGDARVFSVLEGSEIVAAMQVVAFKQSVAAREREARAGVLEGLGGQQFELQRVGRALVYVEHLPEQQFFLWFPPKGAYYEMFVARGDYEQASETFARILAYQQGEEAAEIVLPPDPRRGFEG